MLNPRRPIANKLTYRGVSVVANDDGDTCFLIAESTICAQIAAPS